jgi:uncharacterized protein YecE (DUF72 family)
MNVRRAERRSRAAQDGGSHSDTELSILLRQEWCPVRRNIERATALYLTRVPRPRAYVGTSGWNYRDWSGAFYPAGLPASKWLRHYASAFETVEVNNTFYRKPSKQAVDNWQAAVPAGFRFAVKLWRGITHYRKLKNCAQFLEDFLDLIAPIPLRRRAPLLIQLPANFAKDAVRLASFFDDLRAVQSGDPVRRWRVAVEFRHDSWYTPDIYRLLDRERAALCLHDMQGKGAVSTPNDASIIYVRRHGPGLPYSSRYPVRAIERDVRQIEQWLGRKKQVFVYFNNDRQAAAVRNATQLLERLSGLSSSEGVPARRPSSSRAARSMLRAS